MDLEFTPALKIAWNWAARIAEAEQRDAIEPLDLLRGLLAEDEGHVAAELARDGLALSAWRTRFPSDAGLAGDEPDAAFGSAPGLRLVMLRARQEPSELTDPGALSTAQVLSALLALAGTARETLEAHGYAPAPREKVVDDAPIALDEPLDLSDPADLRGAARIVDASANRAREALRVLEDHARFVLDDPHASRQCKELRHALADALSELPEWLLLQARDVDGDVGTGITVDAERERTSPHAVLIANAKRLQESLRSLEEYGKVLSPTFGERVEKLRYGAYALEKIAALGHEARSRLATARLYALVAESACRASLVGTIRELAEGGVDVVQLREKAIDDRTLLSRAREVRQLTRRLGVLFVVNDRPDVAALVEADGVHLGQDDLSVADARRIVGPKMLVGVSTHDLAQLRQAIRDGASYVGIGPTFSSLTKNFANLSGLRYVEEAVAETSLPAFVLGGVTLDNLPEVVAAGARRVAVSQALVAADDPRRAASEFRKILDAAAKSPPATR